MSDGEGPFTNLLGSLFAFILMLWLATWLLKKVWELILENLPIIVGFGACILAICVLVAIVKSANKRREAVARWESQQLAPLLAQLGAMNKISQAEALQQRMPGAIASAESQLPQLEQRAATAKSKGDSLNLHFT